MAAARKVVLLAGGLGGARLAPALGRALGSGRLTVVANVGDDLDWFGLRVCPDLDSVLYALAGLWDHERGWGRRGETFQVRDALRALGADSWFGVGDGDLATHLERTALLASGRTPGEVAAELSYRLGVTDVEVLPASELPTPTRLRLRDGRVVDFQEWYVREAARPEVEETLLSGGTPSPVALAALAAADAVVLAPSNPVTSIGAILALDGMRDAVRRVARRIAVSPVVLARAVLSPAIEHHARARRGVLAAEGTEDRPGAIARRYAGLAQVYVLDHRDREEEHEALAAGLETVLADLLDERELALELARFLAREPFS